nr:polycomb group protein embryonic flower 2-like isoform X4 [Tanacetum cinerariifolium]
MIVHHNLAGYLFFVQIRTILKDQVKLLRDVVHVKITQDRYNHIINTTFFYMVRPQDIKYIGHCDLPVAEHIPISSDSARKGMLFLNWRAYKPSELYRKLDKDVIVGGQTCWTSIVKEARSLKGTGINVVDLIRLKLGNGDSSSFWEDKCALAIGYAEFQSFVIFAEQESVAQSVPGSNLTTPALLQFAKRSYQLRDPNLETKHCCKRITFFTLTELKLSFTFPMALEQVMAEEYSEDEVDDDVADLEDRRVCSVSLFTYIALSDFLRTVLD